MIGRETGLATLVSRRTLHPEADCVGMHAELLGDAADRSRLVDLGDHAHGPLAHLLWELGPSGHLLLLNLGASTLAGALHSTEPGAVQSSSSRKPRKEFSTRRISPTSFVLVRRPPIASHDHPLPSGTACSLQINDPQ